MLPRSALFLPLALALAACGSSPPPARTPEPAPAPPAPVATPDPEPVAAPAPPPPPPAPAVPQAEPSAWAPSRAITKAVAARDRSADDRALDAGRHPAETLAFFGVAPGQRVADLFAGGGYTSELLARVVGPRGRVFAQNNRFVLERFAEAPWSARLAKPVMSKVQRVDRELESPLPEDATGLDAVIFVLAYHDSIWQHTDRAAMNRAVFAALRPGGVYGIVDHHAAAGSGTSAAETLHRIERDVVVREVVEAGFTPDAEASFLRNPDDAHDWNASPMAAGERRGTSDRFVLRFVKPAGAAGAAGATP